MQNTDGNEDALSALDAQIDACGMLRHPFYQAWTRGDLTRAALRDYAAQYYHHVAAFPTYLSAVHSKTEDAAVRRHLLSNLMDEEWASPTHPELWLQFAQGLGVGKEHVEQSELWPETRSLITAFRAACSANDPAEGLAALYSYESQIPAVAETKASGLRRFYGIEEESAVEYFHVHVEADREHSAVERQLLAKFMGQGNKAAVLSASKSVLDALNHFLSAAERNRGLAILESMAYPDAALIQGPHDVLYGKSDGGGPTDSGTVFA